MSAYKRQVKIDIDPNKTYVKTAVETVEKNVTEVMNDPVAVVAVVMKNLKELVRVAGSDYKTFPSVSVNEAFDIATKIVTGVVSEQVKPAPQAPEDILGINSDNWIPACGGTEQPFKTKTGRNLLYVWQPSTGRHAYLDRDRDIVLTDDEAWEALGN